MSRSGEFFFFFLKKKEFVCFENGRKCNVWNLCDLDDWCNVYDQVQIEAGSGRCRIMRREKQNVFFHGFLVRFFYLSTPACLIRFAGRLKLELMMACSLSGKAS